MRQAEISSLRSAVECHYLSRARRMVLRAAPDGAGGETQRWEPDSEYPCNLAGRPGSDVVMGGRVEPNTLWTLHLPIGTPTAATDRWVVDGYTYEPAGSNAGHTLQIELVLTVRRVV